MFVDSIPHPFCLVPLAIVYSCLGCGTNRSLMAAVSSAVPEFCMESPLPQVSFTHRLTHPSTSHVFSPAIFHTSSFCSSYVYTSRTRIMRRWLSVSSNDLMETHETKSPGLIQRISTCIMTSMLREPGQRSKGTRLNRAEPRMAK